MCSLNDDDGPTNIEPTYIFDEALDEMCKKCSIENGTIKLGAKSALCNGCFKSFVTHKFRASLGSTKVIPKNEPVLVVFDGSPESYVLLDIITDAVSKNSLKKLHLQPTILYVDKYSSIDASAAQQQNELFEKIKSFLSKYEFEKYYIKMNCSMDSNSIQSYKLNDVDVEKINRQLSSSMNNSPVAFGKNVTSANDFTSRFIQNVIRNVAKQLHFDYILLADYELNLAESFLTNMILGRAESVAPDIAFSQQIDGVHIIRPMRDVQKEEIDYFNRLNGRDIMAMGGVTFESNSIQFATKSFIKGLQNSYRSTISTIYKTGSKIDTTESMDSNGSVCEFCNANLTMDTRRSHQAIEYSEYISSNIGQLDIQNVNLINEINRNIKNLHVNGTKYCHKCSDYFK